MKGIRKSLHFPYHAFMCNRYLPPFPASFLLHAAEIVAEMGVEPVKVAVIEPHTVTDHVARKPTGGGQPNHRCFQPGRVLEEGFVRMAENG